MNDWVTSRSHHLAEDKKPHPQPTLDANRSIRQMELWLCHDKVEEFYPGILHTAATRIWIAATPKRVPGAVRCRISPTSGVGLLDSPAADNWEFKVGRKYTGIYLAFGTWLRSLPFTTTPSCWLKPHPFWLWLDVR